VRKTACFRGIFKNVKPSLVLGGWRDLLRHDLFSHEPERRARLGMNQNSDPKAQQAEAVLDAPIQVSMGKFGEFSV